MHETISFWREQLHELGEVRIKAREFKDNDLLATLDKIDGKLGEFYDLLLEAQEEIEELNRDEDEDESEDTDEEEDEDEDDE